MGSVAMKIEVQQLNGGNEAFEVMPEMSVGDFKEQLREHFADSAPRVELIVGDERLVDDNQTVVEAGICPELPVQVIFLEGVDDAEDSEHVKRTGKKHVREKEEKQAILFQFGAFSDSHFW
mmetsp:Transcript_127654/g.180125  ORF Transcript_127654/g.180125 Transcript_127654/m.180125 type:complete len:121 (+) Transcript_127654:31-393(+)|eukprot:symbB.v1.2.015391.t1/scaffold1137.1/size135798/10